MGGSPGEDAGVECLFLHPLASKLRMILPGHV